MPTAQQTFVATAEFNGIIVFNSYFRSAKNTRHRSLRQAQTSERYNVEQEAAPEKIMNWVLENIFFVPFGIL